MQVPSGGPCKPLSACVKISHSAERALSRKVIETGCRCGRYGRRRRSAERALGQKADKEADGQAREALGGNAEGLKEVRQVQVVMW